MAAGRVTAADRPTTHTLIPPVWQPGAARPAHRRPTGAGAVPVVRTRAVPAPGAGRSTNRLRKLL